MISNWLFSKTSADEPTYNPMAIWLHSPICSKDLTRSSLQIAATTIRIRTEIATKIAIRTETDTTANHTDDLIATDLEDITTSIRRKNAAHGNIQTKSIRRLQRSIRPDLVIKPRDNSTADLRTDLSSISLNTKAKKKT